MKEPFAANHSWGKETSRDAVSKTLARGVGGKDLIPDSRERLHLILWEKLEGGLWRTEVCSAGSTERDQRSAVDICRRCSKACETSQKDGQGVLGWHLLSPEIHGDSRVQPRRLGFRQGIMPYN